MKVTQEKSNSRKQLKLEDKDIIQGFKLYSFASTVDSQCNGALCTHRNGTWGKVDEIRTVC